MINWNEIPFVRFLIPFSIGILVSFSLNYSIEYNDYLLFIIGIMLLVFAFKQTNFKDRYIYGYLLNVILFLLGYLLMHSQKEINHLNHFQQYIVENNIVLGLINDMPKKTKAGIQFPCKVIQIGHSHNILNRTSGTIWIQAKGEEPQHSLRYGDLILFSGKIQKIAAPLNPHMFDYQSYMENQNIYYQAYIKSNQIQLIDNDQGQSIYRYAFSSQQYFAGILKQFLPTADEYAVAAALIIGYKNDLSVALKKAYTDTGAIHVLAVSGLHVGLVAYFFMFFFNLKKQQGRTYKQLKYLSILIVIWLFAFMTGAAPSVLRATTMFSFILIGKILNRTSNIYNTLAVSAFVLLCFNPFLIKNIGFQLSYFAVLAIVFFQPKLYNLIYIENKILDTIWQLGTISVAAQIGTLPISLYYFHQFPSYFLLTGIVIVYLATFVLGGGLLLFIVHAIPLLSDFIGNIIWWIISFMNQVIYKIEQFPYHLIKGIWICKPSVFLLYFLTITIAIYLTVKKQKWLAFGFFIAIFLGVHTYYNDYIRSRQMSFVIYHSYKNTIIDIINGRKILSLQSSNISKQKVNYITQNYRWALGGQLFDTIVLDTFSKSYDVVYKKGNILKIFDKKILEVNKNYGHLDNEIKKVDYILFRDNPTIDIADLKQKYEFKLLIFDGSNYNDRIKKWKKTSRELDINVYDINKEGAFIYKSQE